MSATARMQDTCKIERRSAGAADMYNVPAYTWATVVDGMPCRLIVRRARATIGVEAQHVGDLTYKLLLPDTANVAMRDRITVTRADGTVLGPYTVSEPSAMRFGVGSQHCSVRLETVV